MPGFTYDPEDAAIQRDPYEAYGRLREEFPVYHQERLRFWALSRFDDVHDALCDHATFSSAQGLTWDLTAAEQAGVLPMLVTSDPPDHTRLRKLVNRDLTPRRVATLEGSVRTGVRDALARLRAGGGGDLVTDLAAPLPSAVIGMFLGVPDENRHRFHGWAAAVVTGTSGAAYHAEHHRATRELYAFFQALVARRRAFPGDDLLSALATSTPEHPALTDDEILGFCFNLIVGGIETTTNLISSGAVLLQQHPDVAHVLARDPARIPTAVEEFLRLETPVQGLCRTTTRPVERHGVSVPADAKVLLLFAAANRDEREFTAPERLDLERRAERHLAFGYGAHYCVGAALARLMGRVTFEELAPSLATGRIVVDAAHGRRLRSAVNRGWHALPVRAA